MPCFLIGTTACQCDPSHSLLELTAIGSSALPGRQGKEAVPCFQCLTLAPQQLPCQGRPTVSIW